MPAIPPASLAAATRNLSPVVPLAIACCAVIVAIPLSAFRGRLHIPGYVGLAFLTFALGLLVGKLSGTHAIAGTPSGIALSLLFFLLIAIAVGSVLALFFYRDPPES
jgi:lysylphosphatidylglycerol synthetase-like protein (DUF2156 family)